MTIEEMKRKKEELGYSNEMVSDLSGVPLGTVFGRLSLPLPAAGVSLRRLLTSYFCPSQR